jgi:hypothetical protein
MPQVAHRPGPFPQTSPEQITELPEPGAHRASVAARRLQAPFLRPAHLIPVLLPEAGRQKTNEGVEEAACDATPHVRSTPSARASSASLACRSASARTTPNPSRVSL